MMRTYEGGTWGTTSTTLDDAKDSADLIQRLPTLGFHRHVELVCRTGKAELYIRYRATGKRLFRFDYCCIVHIADWIYPILLPDLPDVLRLLQEIDAHLRRPQAAPVHIDNTVEITDVLREVADRLGPPLVSTVNITNVAELKTPLQQVTTLLKEIKVLLTGSPPSPVPTAPPAAKNLSDNAGKKM